MKRRATHKVLRGVLMAAVVVVGLVTGTFHKSRRVEAVDCGLAFQNYLNADASYEIASLSYFHGVPTTCHQDCVGQPSGCYDDCRINRHTTLGQAQIAMLSLALDTCTPATPDQCSQARAMVDTCIAQWQYEIQTYTDPEVQSAANDRLWACREASKIDSCL